MRTIIVIFTDKRISFTKIPSYKKYKFLCNYDIVLSGDIIEDPRYPDKMMVVGITYNTDKVQQGRKLKDIYITKVNGRVINQPTEVINGSLAESNKQKTKAIITKRLISF